MAIKVLKKKKPTTGYLKIFLSRLAMRFYGFTIFALNGIYHEINFVFFNN